MAQPRKVIITCAVTGAIHTPSMSPYLPISGQEIADAAVGAAQAGAAIVHLHARKPEDGSPSQDPELFKAFLPQIKARSDVVINITTGGAPKHPWEQPYLANSDDRVFKNTFKDIAHILQTCAGNGTRFEIECYDIGHLYTAAHFIDRGLIKPPFLIQSVFGLLGGIGPHPEDVAHMHRTANRLFGADYIWSVLGAGRNQLPIAAQSLAMGGNVRVGLEDSLWDGPGQLAKSNAQQVQRARSLIESLSLQVASPEEAREMLQLKGRDKVGF
jgi:uncharacterized protein (DUF849 family)